MGWLGSLIGAVGGVFVKNVARVAQDSAETVKRRPRRFTRWAGWVLAAVLAYHFLVWPILNVHFPEYGFPPIGPELLSVLAGLGM